jgi:hypothetical protein
LLSIALAFDDFKSLLQNFGFALAISNFENFRLGDGKRSKSQYQSHLKNIIKITPKNPLKYFF